MVFYDELLDFKRIDKLIKELATSNEEKEELWAIVDEIVHHKIMGCILDRLPREHHEEFMNKFTTAPFDKEIMSFLDEKTGKKLSSELKEKVLEIENEILSELKNK